MTRSPWISSGTFLPPRSLGSGRKGGTQVGYDKNKTKQSSTLLTPSVPQVLLLLLLGKPQRNPSLSLLTGQPVPISDALGRSISRQTSCFKIPGLCLDPKELSCALHTGRLERTTGPQGPIIWGQKEATRVALTCPGAVCCSSSRGAQGVRGSRLRGTMPYMARL